MSDFFDKYVDDFDNGESKISEHSHRWTEIHAVYRDMLEKILESFVETEGLTSASFYRHLDQARREGGRRDKILLKIIEAQDEYESFVRMMHAEARVRALRKEADGRRTPSSEVSDDDDDDDEESPTKRGTVRSGK